MYSREIEKLIIYLKKKRLYTYTHFYEYVYVYIYIYKYIFKVYVYVHVYADVYTLHALTKPTHTHLCVYTMELLYFRLVGLK